MSQRSGRDFARRYPVSSLCGLFGLSRQGYYKHSYRAEELDVLISGGFAYLSLLTDGYSRAIVGYALHPTLSSEGPLKALQMALDFYRDRGIETEGVIHHSDRGMQYASKEYTKKLLDSHARISMTQTGDPLHNALAEE